MAARNPEKTDNTFMQAETDRVDKPVAKDDNGSPSPTQGMSEEDFETHEKKLVQKLDCTLMPTVWLLYLFNYLDRNNIA